MNALTSRAGGAGDCMEIAVEDLAGGLSKVILRGRFRSEEHTSELQSPCNLVCRLLLEKKKHSTSVPNLGRAEPGPVYLQPEIRRIQLVHSEPIAPPGLVTFARESRSYTLPSGSRSMA